MGGIGLIGRIPQLPAYTIRLFSGISRITTIGSRKSLSVFMGFSPEFAIDGTPFFRLPEALFPQDSKRDLITALRDLRTLVGGRGHLV
jgi:hypothetical protein